MVVSSGKALSLSLTHHVLQSPGAVVIWQRRGSLGINIHYSSSAYENNFKVWHADLRPRGNIWWSASCQILIVRERGRTLFLETLSAGFEARCEMISLHSWRSDSMLAGTGWVEQAIRQTPWPKGVSLLSSVSWGGLSSSCPRNLQVHHKSRSSMSACDSNLHQPCDSNLQSTRGELCNFLKCSQAFQSIYDFTQNLKASKLHQIQGKGILARAIARDKG